MVAFLESAPGSIVVAEGSSEGKDLQNSSGELSFGVSLEKGGMISSYTEVVHGAVGSPVKISLRRCRRRRCTSWIYYRCRCLETKRM
jgi:hypothetical protein